MSYKLVVDSCCDLPEELKNDSRIQRIPFVLQIKDRHIIDDDTFDQLDFIKSVAESEECPKSACPSPDLFMKAFDTDADDIYVVTISSKLSGCYNSAILAQSMYEEDNEGKKKIHVFDSRSACCGETQIVFRVMELAEQGKTFEEIVEDVENYRDGMNTYFVLDNLETLRKNGRLSGVKALVASTLSIKPVMCGIQGSIAQRGQGIGIKKALMRMTDLCVAEVKDPAEKTLMITHCNCYERAEVVKGMILTKTEFKKVVIVDAAGLSTMYANDGGIVVTC
ncbi:MAG: DegV family protein [Butyrivibrio sp.]|nr:DegV family protein [Butyrivibrio sp.]